MAITITLTVFAALYWGAVVVALVLREGNGRHQ